MPGSTPQFTVTCTAFRFPEGCESREILALRAINTAKRKNNRIDARKIGSVNVIGAFRSDNLREWPPSPASDPKICAWKSRQIQRTLQSSR